MRFFLNHVNVADDASVISDEVWESAKRELTEKFQNSTRLETCKNIIKDFEDTNTKKKYKSDLEVFIRESKLEDFFSESGETIFVSTIHKAKGKEFDNVFLMLENFNLETDEAKRQVYVATTRAKQLLHIHLNSSFLNNLIVENLEQLEDTEIYAPPNDMVMHLTHKDIWLDYFINKQGLVSELASGEILTLHKDECLNSVGQSVLKFSLPFMSRLEAIRKKNYQVKKVKVSFIVYWLKEGQELEVQIILPELFFERIIAEA
ncbi:3'-5' exonuclease [Pedobacter endophyticus]|uniref:3'-5' exonuclease n=1 Tax=Pedobacter endophyticus TaxID=2789740 RepID=UPI001E38DB4F|nr:3'-5' exonuclease [Pedobacter endophyticus]